MDIVVAQFDREQEAKRLRATKVPFRWVRRPDGKREKIYILDTESEGFDDQFLKVFRLNVARARRKSRDIKKLGVAAE